MAVWNIICMYVGYLRNELKIKTKNSASSVEKKKEEDIDSMSLMLEHIPVAVRQK